MGLEKQKAAVSSVVTGLGSFLRSAKSRHEARPPLGGRESTLMIQSQARRSVSNLEASQRWTERGRR